jgi:hypothetical protein
VAGREGPPRTAHGRAVLTAAVSSPGSPPAPRPPGRP